MATTGKADVITHASAQAATTSTLARWAGRLWAGRGFFGGLLAIGLGALGQNALMTQNDYVAAQRYYLAAAVLLIASLFHPSWPRFWKGSGVRDQGLGDEGQEVVQDTVQVVAPEQSTPVVEVAAVAPAVEAYNPPAITSKLPTRVARSTSTHGLRVVAQEASTIKPWSPGGDVSSSLPVRTRRKDEVAAQAPEVVAAAEEAPRSLVARWLAGRAALGWRVTVPGLALTAALAAGSAYLLLKDITDPLGGWLWAAALLALLATFIGAPGWPKGAGLLPGPQGDFFARGLPQAPARLELALLIIVLIAAAALRLYNLEYHPGIFGDEGERGLISRAINEGGHHLIFGVGWWEVPNLYFYLVAPLLRIFGDNMTGDRMLSAISGILAVLFVYRVGRLLWGARVGLIAAAMLGVSPLALQFSRLAGESTPTGTLWLIGAFYLLLALRHRRWSDWVLAGIFSSLSLYFYAAGKLVIPLLAVAGVYCLVRWRIDFFKRYALGFALMGVAFLLTFMPYGLFSKQNDWRNFVGRANETSIFSAGNQGITFQRYGLTYDPTWANRSLTDNIRSNPVAWGQLLYHQLRETTDVFHRRGDQVYFYRMTKNNGSVFSPFWAVLTLLGMAYATWKFWDGRFALISIFFWFGMLGSALTVDAPNLQRVNGAWPFVMLFPAVLLDRVFAAAWPLNLGLARKWATVPLAALVLYFGADSYHEYFVHFYASCPYCSDTTQARHVLAFGQAYKGYQLAVGNYDIFFTYGSTRFLAKGVEGRDVLVLADSLPVTDNNGKGAAFIVYPNNADYLPILRAMYPGGTEEQIKGGDGVAYFTSYKLTSEQMAAFQMLHAIYTPQGGNPTGREEANLGTATLTGKTAWSPPTGLAYPATATWQGGLVAPAYGTYTFSVQGADDAVLSIDGREVLNVAASGKLDANVVLAKGVHDVRLTGTLRDASTRVDLLWSSGGGPAGAIEPQFLYNGPTGGLSGGVGPFAGVEALKTDDPFGGHLPTSWRSDSFIGFREASQMLSNAAPAVIHWEGKLNAPVAGDYVFSVTSLGYALVKVNGQVVVDNGVGTGVSVGPVNLTAGQHDVEISYIWQSGRAQVEWYWTRPGGQPELVPPTVLSPLRRSWAPEELPNAPAAQIPLPTGQVEVKALTPDAVFGGDAGLSAPRGLAVDKQGNVYVGDRDNHRIVVFSPDGKVARSWGKAPANPESLQPDEFGDIKDIEIAGDGSVYVLEGEGRIQIFSSTGELRKTLRPEDLGTYGPNGLSLGPDGSIYVGDTGRSRVLKLPPNGEPVADYQSITGSEENKLEQPVDALADPTGSGIYYTIDLKDRVVQFAPDGTVGKQWPIYVGRDAGGAGKMAISPDGSTVYVSDSDHQRVAVLNVQSGEATYFGGNGTNPGQFGSPSGIATGPDGRVYVLDRVNANVQVFTVPKP
jgi:DNA-binding beta-propeller fold protein YncE/4-amino-4-deoxy-L-arabinose transferase-like glycosyltransferase